MYITNTSGLPSVHVGLHECYTYSTWMYMIYEGTYVQRTFVGPTEIDNPRAFIHISENTCSCTYESTFESTKVRKYESTFESTFVHDYIHDVTCTRCTRVWQYGSVILLFVLLSQVMGWGIPLGRIALSTYTSADAGCTVAHSCSGKMLQSQKKSQTSKNSSHFFLCFFIKW